MRTLAYLLILVIALFLSFKLGLYERLIKGPLDAELHVSIDTSKIGNPSSAEWRREVTDQHISITGSTSSPSQVRLRVNGITVDTTRTDAANKFSFSDVAVSEGSNQIEVVAEKQVLWREIRDTSSLWLNYSRPPTQSVPSLFSRNTYVEIGYREMKINLEATMSKDHPIALGVLTGKLTPEQFIEQVFGYVTINDDFIINYFDDTTPTFTSSYATITIKLSATSPTQVFRILSPLGGRLRIRQRWMPNASPVGGNDTFTLNVLKDYAIKSINPVPLELEDGVAKWVNTGQESPTNEIEVQLSAYPWTSPLRLFQATPYEILPRAATRIARVLADILIAVPMLWLLWLSIKYATAMGLDNETARQLNTTTKGLLVLCLVPIAANLTYQFRELLRTRVSDLMPPSTVWLQYKEPITLAIGAILLGLLSAVLFVSVYWFRRRPRVYMLLAFFGSLARAEALIALIFVFSFGVNLFGIWNYRFLTALVLALFSLLFFKQTITWLKATLENKRDPHTVKLGKLKTALLLVVVGLTAYPVKKLFLEIYDVSTWSIVSYYSLSFFSRLQSLTPYLLFPAIMFLLRRAERGTIDQRIVTESVSGNLFIYQLGTLIFASYLVGTSPNWFWVPVPFLLALWIFPKMILQTSAKRETIQFALPIVLVERRKLIRAIDSWANLKQLQAALDSLEKKFGGGDLSFNDYEKRKVEIEAYVRKHDQVLPLESDLRIKDTVLAVGPYNSDWDNGRWAAKRSLFLIVPLLLIYVLVFTIKEFQPQNIYPLLWFCVQIITFVGDGLISAFFFGYFFNSFRGTSGLKKGITVSVFIIVCLLPAWVVPLSSSSLTNILGLFFRVGQTFLFFTILGIWAFDYKNYRDALGGQFQWRKFAKFGDLPSATAFLSVILTSLGVAITTVVTGQFTSIITQLIKVAIPIPVPLLK